MHEKRGVVSTTDTRDTECRLRGPRKQASADREQEEAAQLDDDLTKRIAERVAERLVEREDT